MDVCPRPAVASGLGHLVLAFQARTLRALNGGALSSGPKGRDRTAQGEALGFVGETIRALKARDNRRVITAVPPFQDGREWPP